MATTSVISVIGLGLTLAIGVFQWLRSAFDTKEQARKNAQKEIEDAIASGDISRINAIIQRLRS